MDYKYIFFPIKRAGTPDTDQNHKSNPSILEDDIKMTQELN